MYQRDTVSRIMAATKRAPKKTSKKSAKRTGELGWPADAPKLRKSSKPKPSALLTLDDYDGLKTTVFERVADAAANPSQRGKRGKLTAQFLVDIAIKLADANDFDAVTVRSIGRLAHIPPMRVIRIVGRKDELLMLMIDAVYKELPLPKRGDWRAALRGMSRELRAVAKRHPWFVGPLSGRPHVGPHSFAYLEAALGALPFEKIDQSLDAVRAVTSYTIGGILTEKSELAYGTGRTEWQAASWVYVQNMIRTGKYPTLARVVDEAKHREGSFERGLEALLDGLEATLKKK